MGMVRKSFEYILKVELPERKTRVKDDSQIFGLSKKRIELPLNETGNTKEGGKYQGLYCGHLNLRTY